MCMITEQKKMEKVAKPEVCYQIKLKHPDGKITGIFYYSRYSLVEFGKQYFAEKTCLMIRENNTVHGGVFHCFKNLYDAKRILKTLVANGRSKKFSIFYPEFLGKDVPILVECLGYGEKIIGTTHYLDSDVNGEDCIGYTEITYVKEIEV